MNILQTVQKKLEMTQNSGNFLSWTEDTKYVVVASTRVTNLELSKSCASVCYYRACRDDSMCCKCYWCLHHDCCNHGVNVSTIAVAIMAQMSPLFLLQSWCKCLHRNCCNHGANVSTVVVVLSQIFGFSLISPLVYLGGAISSVTFNYILLWFSNRLQQSFLDWKLIFLGAAWFALRLTFCT